jgi:hypothetical protein
MNAFKWVASGAIGGLVGALIWGAITYFTHTEIGWIAWGIGLLVGLCIRFTAGEEDEGVAPGVVAIGLSAGAILLGKYFAAMMLLGGMSIDLAPATADDVKLMMANAGTDEYETWDEVPADKKATIDARWAALPAEQQADFVHGLSKEQITAGEVFQESFSFFDILWFLLAALTAYRVGSGTASSDDD